MHNHAKKRMHNEIRESFIFHCNSYVVQFHLKKKTNIHIVEKFCRLIYLRKTHIHKQNPFDLTSSVEKLTLSAHERSLKREPSDEFIFL